MKNWFRILTPLLVAAALGSGAAQAQQGAAPLSGDEALLEMQKAFRKGDKARLAQLLPAARGHVLEPWAAYWELRARLDEAQPAEVEAFLLRWAGSYQEDRLRNDWLLLLGQRRDWQRFADQHPRFRMNDDREVRCYALIVEQLRGAAGDAAGPEVLRNWYALREADDGCSHAAAELLAAQRI